MKSITYSGMNSFIMIGELIGFVLVIRLWQYTSSDRQEERRKHELKLAASNNEQKRLELQMLEAQLALKRKDRAELSIQVRLNLKILWWKEGSLETEKYNTKESTKRPQFSAREGDFARATTTRGGRLTSRTNNHSTSSPDNVQILPSVTATR